MYTGSMNKYIFALLLQVEVEAYNAEDAKEAIEESFGEGSACGLNVVEFEVLDNDELG